MSTFLPYRYVPSYRYVPCQLQRYVKVSTLRRGLLAMPKVGLTLVDKRVDTFADILGLKHFGEQVSLDL